MTNPNNGNQDNRYHDAGYQLGNSTQGCFIKSRERARSGPITIMREAQRHWASSQSAVCEEKKSISREDQRLILLKYEEEKSNITEKANTVAAAGGGNMRGNA